MSVTRSEPGVSRPIRVFLADDHELVRRGLSDLFSTQEGIEVVGEAATGAEAMRAIAVTKPDVAILDVQFPDINGVEVCREVRSTTPETACVMLTSFSDDEALRNAILAGACGYLLKQAHGTSIVKAVRAAAAGKRLFDTHAEQRAVERLRAGVPGDPLLGTLSNQERKVLALVANGCTNREIARELGLAEKTVKNYVSNLLGKMGVESRTQAAVYAVRAVGRP